MRKSWILVSTAALSLAACGGAADKAVMESVETSADADAMIEAAGEAADAVASADIVTSVDIEEEAPADEGVEPSASTAPQIAYKYSLGFRLPTNAIKPLQEKHADMCEARGPKVCRIISMRQADEDGDYAYGNLQLAVAADSARAFSKELEGSSKSADAELVSSSIEGEDLSKQIVDTEARLRARTLLRDRLMEILRNREGTVAELVEAERGVAQVNQEIDQARSWLTEMRGRVAFSQMAISYESGSPSSGGFSEPIRNAWNSLGSIFGGMIAFLIVAGAVLIPLGILAWLLWRLFRFIRRDANAGTAIETESELTTDAVEAPEET